jgi:hypothetical protein
MPFLLLIVAAFAAALTPGERTLRARLAAHESWGATKDRAARTKHGRDALDAKFLAEADGDELRAASLRKAYFTRLAFKRPQARRRKAGGGPDDTAA